MQEAYTICNVIDVSLYVHVYTDTYFSVFTYMYLLVVFSYSVKLINFLKQGLPFSFSMDFINNF